MPLNLQNILVGFHGHCTDGLTAAWASTWFGVPDNSLVELNYGEPMPQSMLDFEGDIVFVDYRPKIEDLLRLVARQDRRVFVVDHHKAAYEEACEKLPGTLFANSVSAWTLLAKNLGAPLVYIFDNDHSGARLAWDFFQANSVDVKERPALIDYVEDYDLWHKKLDLTEDINTILQAAPLTLEALDTVHRALRRDDTRAALVDKAEFYREMRNDVVRKAVQNHVFTDLDGAVPGARWPIVASSVFKNEIADRLLSMGYEAVVVWSPAVVEGEWCFLHSLRSKSTESGTVDCAKVAQLFGGNGHQKAAGFATKRPFMVLPVERGRPRAPLAR